MKAINRFPILFLILCSSVNAAPPVQKAPGKTAVGRSEKKVPRACVPLIIEMALLPEPGSALSGEVPARRREYIEEIKTCAQIGAAMVRLQPIAADSSPADYRFDRSVNNYRSLLGDVLAVAPDIIIDCDLKGAGKEAVEWVRCNRRIEFDSTRDEDNPVTVAVGRQAMRIMREEISGGSHLRLGLHDSSAWPYKGAPGNLDYLRQAISMARAARRPIATPAEARKMLGLPPITNIYAVPSSERAARGGPFFLDAIVGPVNRSFKAYGVIVTPSGQELSFAKKGKLSRGISPIVGRRTGLKSVSCVTLTETVIGPRIAQGVYKIYLGLLPLYEQPVARRAFGVATAEVTVE